MPSDAAGPSSPRAPSHAHAAQQQARAPPAPEPAERAHTPPQGPLSAPQSLRELLAADLLAADRDSASASASPARAGGSPQRRAAAGVAADGIRARGSVDRLSAGGSDFDRGVGGSGSGVGGAGAVAGPSSGGARRPSGPVLDPPPRRDPSRWSGFHLWRKESADAARMRQLQYERRASGRGLGLFGGSSSSSGARGADSSRAGFQYRMKRWSRRFVGSIKGVVTGEAYIADDDDDDAAGDRTAHSYFLSRAQEAVSEANYDPEAPLPRWRLALLTLSLAGAQVAWTLELAYGTPFLLGLGLSKEAVSLVWIAGPASGLLTQPVIGALSDADIASKYRRRKYMLLSAACLCASTLVLAFATPLAFFLVDVFGVGLGDWDPVRNRSAHAATQVLSILSFWVLDFALNGLQASARALILDISPTSQQTDANAWQGIMTNAGSVVGYLAGWVDLGSMKPFSYLGGGQFRRFSLFALASMLLCVAVTCATTAEHPEHNSSREHIASGAGPEGAVLPGIKMSLRAKLRKTASDVWNTARRLPRPVRRICLTQAFNFCAWFGFLFYATTYYVEVKQRYERMYPGHGDGSSGSGGAFTIAGDEGDNDRDVEQGSFAMLIYALVSLSAGALLPYLALGSDSRARAPALLEASQADGVGGSSSGARASGLRKRVHRILHALRYGVTLRSMWSFGCLAFALITCGTFFVHTPTHAIVLIALVGVPWSITAWAPYALIGEFVRETALGVSPFEFDDDHHGPRRSAERRREQQRRQSEALAQEQALLAERERQAGFPLHGEGEDFFPSTNTMSDITSPSPTSPQQTLPSVGRDAAQAALRDCRPLRAARGSAVAEVPPELEQEGMMAGTILGIHNLAIVAPQLLMSFIASVIFAITDPENGKRRRDDDSDDDGLQSVFSALSARTMAGGSGSGSSNSGSTQVAWVLRFGGLMALAACVVARSIPLTRTERFRRGLLADQGLVPEEQDDAEEEEDALLASGGALRSSV